MGEVEALDKRPKTNARKEHEVQKPQVYPSRTAATLVLLAFLSFFSAGFAQTKVTFWTWVGLEPAVEQFEAAHPDIDVELVTFGPWDLHDKLLTALAAGSGAPDVAQLVTRRFDAYRDTGQLVDLAPYLDEEYMSQVPASIWPAVSSGDGIYGVPTDYGPGVIWYRKDVFEEYGIEAPISTWEEFIEAGKIVREESNGEQYMMPLYIPSGQWGVASFVQFLQSAGGNLYDESGNLIRDNAQLEEMLSWYHDLVFEHDIAYPVPWFTPSFWSLLESGRFVTLPANTSEGRNIQQFAPDQAGDWGVMPWPRWSDDAPAYTGIWGGNVLAVPEQSQNPEAAIAFAKWLTGTVEGQVAYFEYVGGMPVYAPALQTERLSAPEPFFDGAVITENILDSPTWNWYSEAETTVILGEQIDALFENQVTVEEAIERFEQDVEQRLGR